jgi:hypothetical protein
MYNYELKECKNAGSYIGSDLILMRPPFFVPEK